MARNQRRLRLGPASARALSFQFSISPKQVLLKSIPTVRENVSRPKISADEPDMGESEQV